MHNPGSWTARKRGCTCPVIENRWGDGVPQQPKNELGLDPPRSGDEVYFLVAPDCPIHKIMPEESSSERPGSEATDH